MFRIYAIVWSLLVTALGVVPAEAADTAGPQPACVHPGDAPPVAHTLSDAPDDLLRALRAEYFLDHTGGIDRDRIADQSFHPRSCGGVFTAPVPSQALWLRFAVANAHTAEREWVISFIEKIFDEVVLFEDRDGTLVELSRAGRTIRPEAKDSTALRTGFPIVMQPDDDRVFYLRIIGTFEPTITAVIMSAELFSDWTTATLLMTALFLAYVATFALLSVIVFRQVDRRFYQYYTLYLVCLFMFSFIYDGWLNQLFEVTLPATTLTPVTEGFAGLGMLANVQYCRILLNVDADAQPWRRLFQFLSVVIIAVTGLAVLDPWHLAMPLHLIYFVSPLILLVVAIRKIRARLPQAWPVAASLLTFSGGLFVAVYSFLVPVSITEASSALDVVLARPLSLGYIAAIVGETLFMMLAISTMVRAAQVERRSAVVELAALGQRVKDIEQLQGNAEKTTRARLEALEAVLADNPQSKQHLPIRHQFLDRATEGVLDNIGDQSFGVEKLAAALAVSQKTLGRRLKQANGQSPASFIRSVRLNYARNLILLDQYNTVAEIAHAAGFSSASNFAKLYRQQFGETPSQSIGTLRNVQ
ncbi:helix-turn-helix domain-containing protein [Roseobacter sinensis]|uniref:Helix-turn-helix domain-containing protein n=1 Tax=Roseobacter sinensis TaxID=2931391 RepID=A0ABT3BFD2_9RHOB|nr:helix-turn-helix domain-containing protein [Roseobacter sp. WL0113]MCV3272094.1 helix-turn-helix domain-containing protein [Roseobacter sp. WL0113]